MPRQTRRLADFHLQARRLFTNRPAAAPACARSLDGLDGSNSTPHTSKGTQHVDRALLAHPEAPPPFRPQAPREPNQTVCLQDSFRLPWPFQTSFSSQGRVCPSRIPEELPRAAAFAVWLFPPQPVAFHQAHKKLHGARSHYAVKAQ